MSDTPSEGQRIFDEWRKQSDAWITARYARLTERQLPDPGPAPSLPAMIDDALARAREDLTKQFQGKPIEPVD